MIKPNSTKKSALYSLIGLHKVPRLPECMWKRESCKDVMVAACRHETSQHLSLLPKGIRSVAMTNFLMHSRTPNHGAERGTRQQCHLCARVRGSSSVMTGQGGPKVASTAPSRMQAAAHGWTFDELSQCLRGQTVEATGHLSEALVPP